MEKQIIKNISNVINPYTNEPLKTSEYINSLKYDNETSKVIMEVNLLGDDEQKNKEISRSIIKLLKVDMGILGVKVINNIPTQDEELLFDGVKVLAITSAKGGVGKSNVAYNIAQKLVSNNKKVALVDADILGYSIDKIASKKAREIEIIENEIIPAKLTSGLEIISAQDFLPQGENKAVVWRANMFNGLLHKFFKDTKYQNGLEYLIIDMPPGTGDTLLNLNSYFDTINSVVVTTPSKEANYVSIRIIDVLKELGHNVMGIINSMAYYEVSGVKHYILGEENIQKYALDKEIKFLGEIPIKGERKYHNEDYLNKYYDIIINNILRTLK